MADFVTVQQLVDNGGLTVYQGEDYLDRYITTSEIARPGLALTGFFKFYPHDRIQLFGKTEWTYLRGITVTERQNIYDHMAQEDTPCFIVARNLDIDDEIIAAAEKAHIPILRSSHRTTRVLGNMTNFLESQLAQRLSRHGVLVDVFGIGVLITGESGVGKSETALELVQKGHQLVADDRVELYQKDEVSIVGEPPAILAHLMEIRGIGIVDVMTLFGAGAIRENKQIDLLIHLENWNKDKNYDRLGGQGEVERIFDIDIKKMTIPVKPGRNIAIIIEVAAMNFRSNLLGYDSSVTFNNNLTKLIETNTESDRPSEEKATKQADKQSDKQSEPQSKKS